MFAEFHRGRSRSPKATRRQHQAAAAGPLFALEVLHNSHLFLGLVGLPGARIQQREVVVSRRFLWIELHGCLQLLPRARVIFQTQVSRTERNAWMCVRWK